MPGCGSKCGCKSGSGSSVTSGLLHGHQPGEKSSDLKPGGSRTFDPVTLGMNTIEVRFRENRRLYLKHTRARKLEKYDRVVVQAGHGEFLGTVLKICEKEVCKKDKLITSEDSNRIAKIIRKATEADHLRWLEERVANRDVPSGDVMH